MQAEVASPTYLGRALPDTTAGPSARASGKLVAGLRDAVLRAGVRVFEHSPVATLRREGGASTSSPLGPVRARRVLLAASASPSLLPSMRRHVLAIYATCSSPSR